MGQSPRPRPKRLAPKLRQIRSLLELTQEQMAEAVKHVPSPPQPGHISEYELGKREPSLLFLLAVVRMANLPMEVLVDDELDIPEKLAAHSEVVGSRARQKTTSGAKGAAQKSRR